MEGQVGTIDLACGEHVVVGRHSKCQVSLDEPTLALRALLVRVAVGQDGRPELHIYDLNTGQGFEVDGEDEPQFSLVTQRIAAVRVGGQVLAAVPYDASEDDGPVVREARPEWSGVRKGAGRREVEGSAGSATGIQFLPRGSRHPWLEVKLESRRGSERWRLARSDLELPVLVGRYERCAGHGASTLTTEASRVHLALIADGDDVLVLDTASTNGIERAGEEAASFRVSDEAVIVLSEGDRMYVRRVRGEG